MEGIGIVIWIVFLVIAVLNAKKKGTNAVNKLASRIDGVVNTASQKTPSSSQNKPAQNPFGSNLRMPKVSTKDSANAQLGTIHIVKESKGNWGDLEDRKHDWLAKQLAEERRILLRKDFTDLGAVHHNECSAEKVKKLHILEHDDSVDDGEY